MPLEIVWKCRCKNMQKYGVFLVLNTISSPRKFENYIADDDSCLKNKIIPIKQGGIFWEKKWAPNHRKSWYMCGSISVGLKSTICSIYGCLRNLKALTEGCFRRPLVRAVTRRWGGALIQSRPPQEKGWK